MTVERENTPVQITVRNVSLSEAAKDNIRNKAEKLHSVYDPITSCHVIVEAPHRHHQKGVQYNIRVDITVPGTEIVVRRESNPDLYVAIRDAFTAASRQLREYGRRQRKEVKTHEEFPHARVTKLFAEEGYGFIETQEGLEIYFHKNSVINNRFERLRVGTEVRFVQESGEKGPQASTVTIVGRSRA